MKIFKKISFVLAAGAVGGLVKALAAAAFSHAGINALLGSQLQRVLSRALIYDHLVWGGLWGLLFLLPVRRLSFLWRGVVFSLGQTLVQLLVIFPSLGKGLFGLHLGWTTPLLVTFFGILWGLSAALWLKLLQEA